MSICNFIRAGAFAWIAAEASGISARTFHNWIARGADAEAIDESDDPLPEEESPYLLFLHEVRQAKAQIRALVETQVRASNPLFWLRNGPGKTQPDREGWTDAQRGPQGEDEPLQVEGLLAGALSELEAEEEREAQFSVIGSRPALPAPPEVSEDEGDEGDH